MTKNPIFQKLRKELGLILKTDNQGNHTVFPVNDDGKVIGDLDKNNKKASGLLQSSKFKRAWQWWTKSTYDNPASFNNRKLRNDDLYFMYYNSSIASTAIEMLADETLQSDSQDEYIEVFAKDKKLQKRINELLDQWGINQSMLRDIAFNLALTGDSFLANSIDPKKGVKKVIPVGVYNITDRLEFSLSQVTQQYMNTHQGAYGGYWSRNQFLQDLFGIYSQDMSNDVSDLFESYNFGFVINGEDAVPPWAITHFRRFSSESEFFPFGKPAYIHAIAPYRQLASAMNLQAMARIANFPLKIFSVKNDESNTEMDQFEAINRLRQDYANLGVKNTGKDEITINDELWVAEGLLNVQIESPNIDLNDIADLEMYRENLLTSFRLPKGVIPIGDDNSWGESGKALVQQSKVWGRLVYVNQQALIKGLVDLINLHFAITGEYDNPEFEISIPFPEVEQDRDKQSMKSDSVRLANDIISNLGDALGLDRDESLPMDIVSDVFKNYSFLDDEMIDAWFKSYKAEKEALEKESEEEINLMGEDYKEYRLSQLLRVKEARKRYRSDMKDFLIREAYFKSLKERNLFEGVKANRHFYSSLQRDRERDIWYELIKGNREQKRLKESDGESYKDLMDTFTQGGPELDKLTTANLREYHENQINYVKDIAEKEAKAGLKKFFKL